MLFYFTATGNSLYVAKQLDEERISIPQAVHHREKIYTADPIGVVCPIYGHEVPGLVKEFLRSSVFQTEYFYMILTYGNRHGGAAELAHQMLEGMGIHPAYINLVLMADNFLPAFDMKEQKALDKHVDAQIEKIREDIFNRKRFLSPVTEADREVHREFLRRAALKLPDAAGGIYWITDDCIGCEICTKVCPKNCFTMEGRQSRWNPEGCILCMACIHACPMTAIRMRIPEKNPEARYRNENISICEIIDANHQ